MLQSKCANIRIISKEFLCEQALGLEKMEFHSMSMLRYNLRVDFSEENCNSE